jgi:hypothetical protein
MLPILIKLYVVFWPKVADPEPRLSGIFRARERQVLAESARLVVAYISHH